MAEYSSQLHDNCLSFLNKDDALALLSVMEIVEINAGETLYKAEDTADALYVVVSGRIAVQKPTGFAARTQVVALLDSGAPVGESGLLDGQCRGATLTAVIDSRLLVLRRRAFLEISRNIPSLAVNVLTWLLGRLALRLKKSSERLAHVL